MGLLLETLKLPRGLMGLIVGAGDGFADLLEELPRVHGIYEGAAVNVVKGTPRCSKAFGVVVSGVVLARCPRALVGAVGAMRCPESFDTRVEAAPVVVLAGAFALVRYAWPGAALLPGERITTVAA